MSTEPRPALFTAAFLRVWLIAFAAGAAGFLLFPTVPFRMRELGAPAEGVGLFLTALTFGSAVSAAWTGALGDRLGRRRVLTVAGLGLAGLTALYAVLPSWWLLTLLGLVHGVVWSSILTGGSAEAARVVPERRRAEGIAWHGMAMTLAVTVAPAIGFRLLERGWTWLCGGMVGANLLVAALARALPASPPPSPGWLRGLATHRTVEWRTLRSASVLFAVSFGYGGVTSFAALLAEERSIEPKGIFFTAFAVSILVLRPALGPMVDRLGARRMIPPAIGFVVAGLALLPFQDDAIGTAIAALVFGAGFSTLYPAFSTLILARIPAERHGAAFGAMLAAFDVGIGTGSFLFGPLVEHLGPVVAFLGGAAVALAAWPLLILFEPDPAGARAARRRGTVPPQS
ncbi:MAG TPA: MFS transporter [Thermoanaerobaculia bacterium]|nr:MFS transporter [Thermoanaerobaculia bacterium]